MKTHHFLLFLSLLAVSCTKDRVEDVPDQRDDTTPLYPISIRAGQDTGVGINYVDFSPDLSFNLNPYLVNDSLYLDLDSDLVNDFKLVYYKSSPFQLGAILRYLTITPLGNNQICVHPSNTNLADSLVFNDPIDSTRTWSAATALLFRYSWTQAGYSTLDGYFLGNIPYYYVGLRLTKDQHDYYGWLFLNHAGIDRFAMTRVYYEE